MGISNERGTPLHNLIMLVVLKRFCRFFWGQAKLFQEDALKWRRRGADLIQRAGLLPRQSVRGGKFIQKRGYPRSPRLKATAFVGEWIGLWRPLPRLWRGSRSYHWQPPVHLEPSPPLQTVLYWGVLILQLYIFNNYLFFPVWDSKAEGQRPLTARWAVGYDQMQHARKGFRANEMPFTIWSY